MEVMLRIHEIATEKGWTQRELSKRSGVSVQQINRYWNNHMNRVELDALAKITETLGVTFNDIIVVKK